ncbi:MAG: hypothetical protein JNL97_01995 [Verrucomicrobiales bacterium]|nr:hypothetical protein [Verrucomicrobiales bacterium]
MKPVSVMACLVGLGLVATPELGLGGALVEARRIADIPWPTNTDEGSAPPSGIRRAVDGRDAWSVTHTNATPVTFPILTLEGPAITQLRYAVTGEVSYAQVEGDAYLEMWSHFPAASSRPGGSRAFSRTLAPSGRLGRIAGSSSWRGFELPMDATGAPGLPTKLELNLFLPGRGTVHVASMGLVEYPHAWPWTTAGREDVWWNERQAGWLGGVAGGLFGGGGAILAALAAAGRARKWVIRGMVALIALGVCSLVVGAVAFFVGQPRVVWLPLGFIGALTTAILTNGLRQMVARYRVHELRKITAADHLNA